MGRLRSGRPAVSVHVSRRGIVRGPRRHSRIVGQLLLRSCKALTEKSRALETGLPSRDMRTRGRSKMRSMPPQRAVFQFGVLASQKTTASPRDSVRGFVRFLLHNFTRSKVERRNFTDLRE
jgi:hypothetical protein